MNRLSTVLPPFTRDYSGVCSALFELGGMTVIHGANGCTGNYTAYDEPRWYGSNVEVVGSGLCEIEAVMGNDEKLIGRVIEAADRSRPRFICVTGTPVPMLIGTDFTGIAKEIEKRTGIPAFGFATTGLSFYDRGAAEALTAYVKRFARAKERIRGALNLIGATAIDFYQGESIRSLKSEFNARGYQVISSMCLDTSVEAIENSAAAEFNVVVANSGMKTARHLEQVYGTPYLVGIPVGEKATADYFTTLAELRRDRQSRIIRSTENGQNARILIIGEVVAAQAIRHGLAKAGIADSRVCALFSPDRDLLDPSDLYAQGEAELRQIINHCNCEIIVADPLFRSLREPNCPATFVDFPTIAVSSKLHWEKHRNIVGRKGDRLLREIQDLIAEKDLFDR